MFTSSPGEVQNIAISLYVYLNIQLWSESSMTPICFICWFYERFCSEDIVDERHECIHNSR